MKNPIATFLTFSIHLFQVVGSNSLSISSPAQSLRDLFRDPSTFQRRLSTSTSTSNSSIILPGVHDALSAKIYAQSGARVLFLSGFGVSASRLGQPDMGILSQTEMEDTLRSVVQAATVVRKGNVDDNIGNNDCDSNVISEMKIHIPVIVDGDTGYGGAANIRRMVHSFAAAGAAAITIEDQVFPKKCTYAAGGGVRVVSREESLVRVRAALAARDEIRRSGSGGDVLIVARTDCRAALGLEEAIERCKMYEDAGADIVYAENLQSREEYEDLRRKLDESTPTILAQVQVAGSVDVGQNLYSAEQVGDMGFDFCLFGITGLQAAVAALQNSANIMLHGKESTNGLVMTSDVSSSFDFDNGRIPPLTPFNELKDIVGFEDSEKFQSKYEL